MVTDHGKRNSGLSATKKAGVIYPKKLAKDLTTFTLCRMPMNQSYVTSEKVYRRVAFRAEGPRSLKFSTLYDHRFGADATLHSAWTNLTAFEYGYREESLPDLLEYQQELFGAPSAHAEALIRLYPLPAHNHAWYYAWLGMPHLNFLKSRSLYQECLYPSRIQTILQNAIIYKPEVVLMYGMENINMLKESIKQFFSNAKFKTVKGVKRQIPQHHWAHLDRTTVVITTQIPALRHNLIETGFDWYEFGKLVRAQ